MVFFVFFCFIVVKLNKTTIQYYYYLIISTTISDVTLICHYYKVIVNPSSLAYCLKWWKERGERFNIFVIIIFTWLIIEPNWLRSAWRDRQKWSKLTNARTKIYNSVYRVNRERKHMMKIIFTYLIEIILLIKYFPIFCIWFTISKQREEKGSDHQISEEIKELTSHHVKKIIQLKFYNLIKNLYR